MSFFSSLGVMGIPLAIVLVLTLVQIVRSTTDVMKNGPTRTAPTQIHSILLLGVSSACLGVLGTLVGIWIQAGFIAQAGSVSQALAWSGVRVALTSSILGFLTLGVASVAWLVLQWMLGRHRAAAV